LLLLITLRLMIDWMWFLLNMFSLVHAWVLHLMCLVLWLLLYRTATWLLHVLEV
jgi:hypothetical protein